jgi:TonB family protein
LQAILASDLVAEAVRLWIDDLALAMGTESRRQDPESRRQDPEPEARIQPPPAWLHRPLCPPDRLCSLRVTAWIHHPQLSIPSGARNKSVRDAGWGSGPVFTSANLTAMKTRIPAWSCLFAFLLLAQTAQSGVPLAAPEVVQDGPVTFPFGLQRSGVQSGKAWIVVGVDATGKLEDTLVTGYTRHEFAEVARAAVQHWKFRPPVIAGQPRSFVQELSFDFSSSGVLVNRLVVDTTAPSTSRLADERLEYQLCATSDLDHLPVPIQANSPSFPPALAKQFGGGSVIVEFYVDESGNVRLPSVATASDPEIAALAVEAVRKWKFEPPVSHGRPVLVLARQVFRFMKR